MDFQYCTMQQAKVIFDKLERFGFSKEQLYINSVGKGKYIFTKGDVKIKFDYDRFYLVTDVYLLRIEDFENIINAVFYFSLNKKNRHLFNKCFFYNSLNEFDSRYTEYSFLYMTDDSFLKKKEHLKRFMQFYPKKAQTIEKELNQVLFFEQERNFIKEKLN